MPATVRVSYYGASASEPAGVNAETGIKFNRADSQTGTTPVPIPDATGTNFSWIKNLALEVTATSTTAITNRRVKLATAPAAGLKIHAKGSNTYAQAASGNMPAASGSNGATPSTFTNITEASELTYHSGSVSTGSAGRNGDFCVVVAGVDNTYAGGAGSNQAVPNLTFTYDEA